MVPDVRIYHELILVMSITHFNIVHDHSIINKRRYEQDNPFEKDYYIINPIAYLYNNEIIDEYLEEEYSGDNNNTTIYTPKNEYRIGGSIRREQRII